MGLVPEVKYLVSCNKGYFTRVTEPQSRASACRPTAV